MQVASSLPEVCGHCSSRSFKRSSLHRWLDVDVEVDIVVSRRVEEDHRLDVVLDYNVETGRGPPIGCQGGHVETEVETDIARAALPELWQTA